MYFRSGLLKNTNSLIFGLIIILSILVGSILFSHKTEALTLPPKSTRITIFDRAHVQWDNRVFFDVNTNDSDDTFDAASKNCPSKTDKIHFIINNRKTSFPWGPGDIAHVYINTYYDAPADPNNPDSCNNLGGENASTDFKGSIAGSPDALSAPIAWNDSGEIDSVFFNPLNSTQNFNFLLNKSISTATIKRFERAGDTNCKDSITVNISTNINRGFLVIRLPLSVGPNPVDAYREAIQQYDKWMYDYTGVKDGFGTQPSVVGAPFINGSWTKNNTNGCWETQRADNTGAIEYHIGRTAAADEPEGSNAGTKMDPDNGGLGNANDNGNGVNFDCEVQTFNPLTWFLCPVVELLQGFINWFDEQINSLLRINTENFNDQQGHQGRRFYQAWSSIRTISMILVVIIGLVMIISTAISSGPFDAYTIRKVLPRLVIAVIGIALSWRIMQWFAFLVNAVGENLGAIIQAPFAGLDLPKIGAGTGTVTGAFFAVGIGLALVGTSFLAAISLLVTAAIGVIVAFIVLLVRQIVISLLAILVPLAIVAYVLPNTQRIWKLWYETFTKAMWMYPIIVAFIAGGKVFAQVTYAQASSKAGGERVLYEIIAFVAVFVPYFMLPATVRLAGGAINAVTGSLNNRSKGAFDRLRNFRGQNRQATLQRSAEENKFKGAKETGFRSFMNRNIGRTMAIPAAVGSAGLLATLKAPRKQTSAVRGSQFMGEVQKVMQSDSMRYIGGNEDNMIALKKAAKTKEDVIKHLQQTATYKLSGRPEDAEADAQKIQAASEAADHIMQIKRTSGDKVVKAAAVIQRAQSKNGYKNGEMEAEIASVVEGDMLLASNMLVPMRSAQDNAGRSDNVTSFGSQIGRIQRIHNGEFDKRDEQGNKTGEIDVDAVGAETIKESYSQSSSYKIAASTTAAAQNYMKQAMKEWMEAVESGSTNAMIEAGGKLTALRSSFQGATPEVKKVFADAIDGVSDDKDKIYTGLSSASTKTLDVQLAEIVAQRGIKRADYAVSSSGEAVKVKPDITLDAMGAQQKIRTVAATYDQGIMTQEERAAYEAERRARGGDPSFQPQPQPEDQNDPNQPR